MEWARRADELRQVAQRLGLDDLKTLTLRPGVNESLRLTVQYHDGRSPASVATLQRGIGTTCALTVVYQRYDRANQPYQYSFALALPDYQQLLTTLRQSKFDSLDDSPDLPNFGLDLWLVERAAGSFHHDVVLAPALADGHHREVALALRKFLPEAMRELA
jgi:hypothetical protein